MIGGGLKLYTKATSSIKTEDKGSNTVIPFYDHHKSRLVETMTFWAECHGGFKGFSPNEYFEWEDSHPFCSNALSPSGSIMITITMITILLWIWRSQQRRGCGEYHGRRIQE